MRDIPLNARAREEEMLYREYRRCIQPYLDAKIKYVYNVTLPELVIYPDGRMTSTYRFADSQQEFLSAMDDVIATIARLHFRKGHTA